MLRDEEGGARARRSASGLDDWLRWLGRARLGAVLRGPLGRGVQQSRRVMRGVRRAPVLDGDAVPVAPRRGCGWRAATSAGPWRMPSGRSSAPGWRRTRRFSGRRLPSAARCSLAIGSERARRSRRAPVAVGKPGSERHGRASSDWMADLPPCSPLLGREEEFLELVARIASATSLAESRAVAYARAIHGEAADDLCRDRRPGREEAFARLRAAEPSSAKAGAPRPTLSCEQALAFWRTAGATAYVRGGRSRSWRRA